MWKLAYSQRKCREYANVANMGNDVAIKTTLLEKWKKTAEVKSGFVFKKDDNGWWSSNNTQSELERLEWQYVVAITPQWYNSYRAYEFVVSFYNYTLHPTLTTTPDVTDALLEQWGCEEHECHDSADGPDDFGQKKKQEEIEEGTFRCRNRHVLECFREDGVARC